MIWHDGKGHDEICNENILLELGRECAVL